MRLALAGGLLAGVLAMLLTTQLAATQELSIKKQNQKQTNSADDNNEQTQDKSKDIWEEQQERRLLVKRAISRISNFRADPMLPDTRRGGLGSSARSIGDPSVRSAFFSKRRRLHSRARSGPAKARAMARAASGRTLARSAARSPLDLINKRSVVPGGAQRRRLRSGARSMLARRGRRLRQSRRFTGWQPMQLGRFTRSTGEENEQEDAQIGESFDQSLGSIPATARAGFAPFLQAPTIVEREQQPQQQQPCLCAGSQVSGSQREASQNVLHEALGGRLKTEDAQVGAHFKDGQRQKSEQLSSPKGAQESPRAQTLVPMEERLRMANGRIEIELDKKQPGMGAREDGEAAADKDKEESREPHGGLTVSQGETGTSSGGIGLSSPISGELGSAIEEPEPDADVGVKGRAGVIDQVGEVAGAVDKAAETLTNNTLAKTPVVGKLVGGVVGDLDLKKVVKNVQSGVDDALLGEGAKSRSASADDASSQTLQQATAAAGSALESLKNNKKDPSDDAQSVRASTAQKAEKPLEQVEKPLDKIVDKADGALNKVGVQSESPRAKQEPGSQAEASVSQPLEAKVSLGGTNSVGAKGSQEEKLDDEIKNIEPNPEALKGTKRGPGLLEAIGDDIKHKLETPEVKQEVKPAVSADGKLEVEPELQRERDDREAAKEQKAAQPHTRGPQQEWADEEEPKKEVLKKPDSERENDHQVAWAKSEGQHEGKHSASSPAPSVSEESHHEGPVGKLETHVEEASKALAQKVEEAVESVHEHSAEKHHGQDKPATALRPGTKPLQPEGLLTQHKHPLKSAKGVAYKHLLKEPAAEAALYESPRIDRLPAKCASKLSDLAGVLDEILLLIEKLGQRVLADSSIDYLARDSLSRKLAMVRAFAEEARMQANLGQLRRLNDSARAAGVELMRLANWSVAHKLDKSLRPLALQTRKLYIAYRKSCKGVASS